jgi:hypothetical protein
VVLAMARKVLKIEALEAKYSGIKGYRVIVLLLVKDFKTLWCKLMIPSSTPRKLLQRETYSQSIPE